MSETVHFLVAEPSGRIVATGQGPADQVPYQAMPGMIAKICDPGVRPDIHYLDGEAIAAYPERPRGASEFDFSSKSWQAPAPEVTAILDAEAWDRLRRERDRRLTACDWTQVADAPVDRSAWAAYRQELRDMPSRTTDPENPDWPLTPA